MEHTEIKDKHSKRERKPVEVEGILPDILALYESEEGQKELAAWKAKRKAEQAGQKVK